MGITGWAFIWTAIMPLTVLLYYFFRKKFQDRRISSTLYWEELMQESEASPFLKNLQRNLLLYLQLAALLLLVFALLGPFFKTETLTGSDFILIVDPSATMLAGSPSHFEKQKEEMRQLIRRTGGKPVTIITAGAEPRVVIRNERDVSRLEAAIADLTVTYEADQAEQALYLAGTLADPETTSIHVFTDVLDRELLFDKAGGQFVVHAAEEERANVSIRQFGLAHTENGLRAVVQLVNDQGSSKDVELRVYSNTHEQTVELTLDEGEERIIPVEGLAAADFYTAEIKVADDYTADNVAAAFADAQSGSVIVDASLHDLMKKGFQSLETVVRSVPSDQLIEQSGLLVTNQTALLKSADPVLLVGRDDEELHEVEGKPVLTDPSFFAFSSFEEVFVASLYPPFEGYRTVAAVGDEPFIQVSPDGDVIILTDLEETDWPLHPSFPLFLWTVNEQLSKSAEFLGTFAPNEQRAVALPTSSKGLEIFKDGEFVQSFQKERTFRAPAQIGVFDVIGDKTQKMIVALPAQEKELAVGASYQIGAVEEAEETIRVSAVPWLAIVILGLLLVEWEVYRRGTAR